jgi:flagella basal body P-ring formation protein FlgA
MLAPAAGAQAVVRGEWIALRDVAPVAGEAGDILLGPAPPPGQTLALDPAFVVAVARKSGVALAIPLDAPLWVTRSAERTSAAAAPRAPSAPMAPVARTALIAAAAGDRTDLVGTDLAGAEVLVLVRDLKRGEVLRREDLAYGAPPAGRMLRSPASLEAAIGLAVRRNLMAGAALESHDLETPDLVRKGEAVTILYATPGMRLAVAGLAQNDAGMGETVRVLNQQSRRSLDAVVTGPGEANLQRR